MSNVTKVHVGVNRAEAIRRGLNGTDTCVLVELDMAALPQEDRDDIARRLSAEPLQDCAAPLLRAVDAGGMLYRAPMIVADPSQSGVLEVLAAEREAAAEHAAEREAEEAAKEQSRRAAIDTWLATEEDALIETITDSLHWRRDDRLEAAHAGRDKYGTCAYYRPHRVVGRPYGSDYRHDEVEAQLGRLDTLAQQHDEEEIQSLLAERDAYLATRRTWIAAHGSGRLITMEAEEIECEATYERERSRYDNAQFAARLADQRPGWELAEEDEVDRHVADVPMRALRILAAGRTIAPQCRLAKRDGKYVCVDTFEGRLIVWPPQN